ncbi:MULTISPECIES: 2-hydroxyacid dehydrogenase [Fusobacterium]|uniref:2-hydroxyacid dehydrogenase n=1 Tax=Fusobacterium TaxID=848 RepID=UPI001476BC64|nr:MULTISPECIES: 2-hydroxyacid dehydrogenase [Fusobacterium]NME35625.1 hydroxyacid dehydrogenase [Fusobacterium sp. FSA-380-WT-3A]
MKVKLIEPLVVSKNVIDNLSKEIINMGHEFIYYDTKTTDIEEMKKRVSDADILMIANNPLPNEVIESAPNLKMISIAFTGFDHVGKLVKERNIIVCNAAGYANNAVAELVIGLTLDLMRNINKCNSAIRKGGTIAGLIGGEIRGKTVGIIGTGRIGTMTANLFKCMGANLLGYDVVENEEAKNLGIRYVNIDELMKTSDIISLHLPLDDNTKGFISKEKLELMKETSILINCARGGVVDNKALAEILNEEKIAGAGIDVFDMEPPIPSDYPLLNAKNTILTPHVAFASHESMKIRAKITFDNVINYLKGTPTNIVKL